MVTQRLGIPLGKPILNDFPEKSRQALANVLYDLSRRQFIFEGEIWYELVRISRSKTDDLENLQINIFPHLVFDRLRNLKWYEVMVFCERVNELYLHSVPENFQEAAISLEEVRSIFIREINQILQEDNIAFSFEDGQFKRRGHPQTQKAIERAGAVLSDPNLEKVKTHFNKSLQFFNIRPKPDNENGIKEALCALEACIEILTEKKASSDFDKAISQLEGNGSRQIPPPIGESMKKLFGYRGSGEGVAHAAIKGNRVSPIEAELVLSLVASYITYLVDLFPSEEDIPF
jgi:hypothetical protein